MEIPGLGWIDILYRVWSEIGDNRVLLVAAGVTFYSLLAFVPALSALVAIYGLAFDQREVTSQVALMSDLLPAEVLSLVTDQLTRLAAEPSKTLGATLVISLALALWSASAATKSLIDGLNVVYQEVEKRPWWKYNAVALAITAGGLVLVLAMLALTLALPVVLSYLYPGYDHVTVSLLADGMLALGIWVGVILLYRWAPSRQKAEWPWLLAGSLLAVVAVLAASMGFSWYARTFTSYGSYGSLGAVIAFMVWGWISTVILLLGAEINAEIEHQTAIDTTTGPPQPMGMRGATMADTLGRVAHARTPRANRRPPLGEKAVFDLALVCASVGLVLGFLISHVRADRPRSRPPRDRSVERI
ncbi:MAG: YihY/virulence factor BrkB family protein [Hyphomicrobiaceae bacterium]